MLTTALPFNIGIVYFIYDNFTIYDVVQMNLCWLLVHVLMHEKKGL